MESGWKSWFNGRNYSRGVHAIVMNGVLCFHGVRWHVDGQRAAGLRIGLVKRCARAGDGDADAVAGAKNLAHPTDVKCELVDFAGLKERFVIEAVAIASAPRVVTDQNRTAVGIDIADAHNEVSVASC